MADEKKAPAGKWKSRTLWSFLALCVLTLLFLVAWLWAVRFTGARSYDLAMQGKEIPVVYQTVVQTFPLGAIASGLGAAAVAFIGGNKARDAVRSVAENKRGEG